MMALPLPFTLWRPVSIIKDGSYGRMSIVVFRDEISFFLFILPPFSSPLISVRRPSEENPGSPLRRKGYSLYFFFHISNSAVTF